MLDPAGRPLAGRCSGRVVVGRREHREVVGHLLDDAHGLGRAVRHHQTTAPGPAVVGRGMRPAREPRAASPA